MAGSAPHLTPEVLGAERALIGGMLLPDVAATLPPLRPEEFFADRHRVIWKTIIDMDVHGERAGLISLATELEARGDLEAAGGAAHLALCVQEACLDFHLLTFARQIRDAARERTLRALGLELQQQNLTPAQITERLEDLPGPLTTAIFDPAHNWQRIVASWDQALITTGLHALDALTVGITPGELMVIAGRTSHGKTAFALDLTLRLATAGVAVDFVTLEETADAIVRRLVANRTGLPLWRLKKGELAATDFADAEHAVAQLQALPLTVTALDTIRTLDESSVVAVVASSKAPVVILDHLQKIHTSGDSRVYGLERVLNRLHAVGLKHQRAIIVNAQLSREMDAQKRPPELRDLRDSGATEQSARQVWLLYWPAKQYQDRLPNEYELYVAKNNDGGTGVVRLDFDATCGRFSEPGGAP